MNVTSTRGPGAAVAEPRLLRPCRPHGPAPFAARALPPRRRSLAVRAADKVPVATQAKPSAPSTPAALALSSSGARPAEGPSSDLSVIFGRLATLATPYWTEGNQAAAARWRLAGVLALTLGTTGVSVAFNFLGRDFFNALSAKDQAKFTEMLFKWLAALCAGIPVFVLRDFYQARLALEWREWMTRRLTDEYFAGRTFYRVQAGALLDNPDQRIAVDVRNFTDTTLASGVTLLNAAVDLVSFSGILFTIYPPLFVALLVYSVGGTAASLAIGRPLIGLNFLQEAAEANFRYGLVRVRENAESIAFYGGEGNEARLLGGRLRAAVDNFGRLLVASRNLNFFTSFYRFLIGILPAAVVAPLFFRGEIEFGVVNQSSSAFNHILSDVSLVVFQFESLAGFSAVIDRLGQLTEVLATCRAEDKEAEDAGGCAVGEAGGAAAAAAAAADDDDDGAAGPTGRVVLRCAPPSAPGPLLQLRGLSLTVPPPSGATLVRDLTLEVRPGESLLIMGPSGAGKTSLLRTVAGLWRSGGGEVVLRGRPMGRGEGRGDVFFVPQRPYVVLGTLRDQLLYPTWACPDAAAEGGGGGGGAADNGSNASGPSSSSGGGSDSSSGSLDGPIDDATYGPARPLPSDAAMRSALEAVQLGSLLARVGGDLDSTQDWASVLSLGEQQRVAFARVLLARPALVLMDESTSALDTRNERVLYEALRAAGVTYVSVGHRPTLLSYHQRALLLAGDGTGGWSVAAARDVPLETAVAFME